MTSAQNKRNGPLFRLGMSFIGLNSLDLFGNIRTDTGSSGTEVEVILNDKFENFCSSVDLLLDLIKIKM